MTNICELDTLLTDTIKQISHNYAPVLVKLKCLQLLHKLHKDCVPLLMFYRQIIPQSPDSLDVLTFTELAHPKGVLHTKPQMYTLNILDTGRQAHSVTECVIFKTAPAD